MNVVRNIVESDLVEEASQEWIFRTLGIVFMYVIWVIPSIIMDVATPMPNWIWLTLWATMPLIIGMLLPEVHRLSYRKTMGSRGGEIYRRYQALSQADKELFGLNPKHNLLVTFDSTQATEVRAVYERLLDSIDTKNAVKEEALRHEVDHTPLLEEIDERVKFVQVETESYRELA